MKKLLLIIISLSIIACAKDTVDNAKGGAESAPSTKIINSSVGAVAGILTMEVTPEVAERIEVTNQQRTRSGEPLTRAGISDMDLVFDQIGVERFARTFPYEEHFEERHRAFGLHLWYTLSFNTSEELDAAARLLSKVEGISVIEFRHKIKRLNKGRTIPYNKANVAEPQTRAALPMNDPELAAQWHYNNTGTVIATQESNQYKAKAGADIGLYEAWELCTGNPEIIVAVLDDPVQTTHPDLAANIWVNPSPGKGIYKNDINGYNFYNQTGKLDWQTAYYNSDYQEWQYADHGTHVAGTIAAVNGNNVGVCGVAGGKNGTGGVKIMSCQIMGNSKTNADEANAAANAFVYAADRGALIAQCSWGYGTNMTQSDWEQAAKGSEKSAVDYFIANAGYDNPNSPLKGGLVVFAAGNDGDVIKDQTTWPAAYSPVIAVASMAPDYAPAYYTDYGRWADITAPGGDYLFGEEGAILSTILQDPAIQFEPARAATAGYGYMQGTSMACPHVSGAAALALSYAASQGKQYTLSQFKTMLLSAANDINPYMTGTKKYLDPYSRWKTLTLSNYNQKMGSGYIDAYRLLLEIKGTPSIYIQQGKSTVIDLTKYFGAGAAYATFTADISKVGEKLGVTKPTIDKGKMSITCAKNGAGTITLTTTLGDTTVSKEIALIVRETIASNGGWL